MHIHIDASGIERLARDFGEVPPKATRDVGRAVEKTAKEGLNMAQDFARGTARRHGKWYPSSMTAESKAVLGLSWVYGPQDEPHRRQGGMSFEHGSRNQPPHLDLAHSADRIAPIFMRRVDEAIGKALNALERG